MSMINKRKKMLLIGMFCLIFMNMFLFEKSANIEVCAQENEEISDLKGEIKEGELVEVFLNPDECRHAKYKFIPAETDSYVFYSISDSDTSVYLYNSTETIIDSDLVRSGRGGNFSLECELSAGSTYYIGVQFANSATEKGSFLVGVKRALKEENFTEDKNFTDSMDGMAQSIDDVNKTVRFRFQPNQSGYYSIFSKDYCQENGICGEGCICKEQSECQCLNKLMIEGYIMGEEGKLVSHCFSESGQNRGFLIYSYFEKGQTYYFEISAIEAGAKGNFVLCIGKDITSVSLDMVELDKNIENYLEDNTQELFYGIQPSVTETYHFTSQNGQWLYMTLYDSQMKEIAKSEEFRDNFDIKAKMEQGKSYYLKISTKHTMTVNFQFQMKIAEKEPEQKPNEKDENQTSQKPSNNTGQTGGTTSIIKKKITSVKLSGIGSKVYTGKKIKPSVVLKDGKTTLKIGKDYTLLYSNNVKIGTAKVIITGKGKYEGKRTTSFKIIPNKTKIKSGKKKGKKLTLKWSKVKGVSGYEIKYSNSSKFKKAKTKKVKGCKVTLKLKNKKKYYVKIRAYKKVGKQIVYGKYTKSKKY